MRAWKAESNAADPRVEHVDMTLETIVMPVSDVDRAKAFSMVAEQSGAEPPR
jgi:hypothetical protein